MGGNLHRGFESLPLRSAHGGRGDLVARASLAGPEVAECAAEGADEWPDTRIAHPRAELPRIALQVVELPLAALVLHVEPPSRAHRAPRGHARLRPARAALACVDAAASALACRGVKEGTEAAQPDVAR